MKAEFYLQAALEKPKINPKMGTSARKFAAGLIALGSYLVFNASLHV